MSTKSYEEVLDSLPIEQKRAAESIDGLMQEIEESLHANSLIPTFCLLLLFCATFLRSALLAVVTLVFTALLLMADASNKNAVINKCCKQYRKMLMKQDAFLAMEEVKKHFPDHYAYIQKFLDEFAKSGF